MSADILGELASLFTQTVTINAATTALDQYGNKTYGAAQSVRARVVGRHRVVRDATGEERLSTVTIYLGSVTGITPLDKITLPSGYVPQSPPILDVRRQPDDTGVIVETVLT